MYIYKTLGCFHSLQPTEDPYEYPSIPTLFPIGFVTWQTLQLLLCPAEHAKYLQEAVKRFDIINPVDGSVFPRDMPRDVFPSEPDSAMVEWYNEREKPLSLPGCGNGLKIPSRGGHSLLRIINSSANDPSGQEQTSSNGQRPEFDPSSGTNTNGIRYSSENCNHNSPFLQPRDHGDFSWSNPLLTRVPGQPVNTTFETPAPESYIGINAQVLTESGVYNTQVPRYEGVTAAVADRTPAIDVESVVREHVCRDFTDHHLYERHRHHNHKPTPLPCAYRPSQSRSQSRTRTRSPIPVQPRPYTRAQSLRHSHSHSRS